MSRSTVRRVASGVVVALVSVLDVSVAAAEAPDAIALERRVLELALSRPDLTVGVAILTVFAPDDDWTVSLAEADRARLFGTGAWKTIELKPLGGGRFELPPLRIAPGGENSGPLCMSLKVWFAEITNQYDSPFYVETPDRYALLSYCTEDRAETRARHSQNRVATLDEFKARLAKRFTVRLRDDRVPWRPGVLVDSDGNVLFHSLIVAPPSESSYATHLPGVWKRVPSGELERLPTPDLRRWPTWPEHMRRLAADGAAGLATIAYSEVVGRGADGNLYTSQLTPGRDGRPSLLRVVRVDASGEIHAIAGSEVGHRDGPAAEARFANVTALAAAPSGDIVVADGDIATGSWIRRIARDGRVTTLAGGDEVGFRDGDAAAARFFTPSALAIDAAGTIYVADPVNSRIRTVSSDGVVRSIAADPAAPFVTPTGVAIGPDGALFVLDGGPTTARVRKRRADGVFETLAVVDAARARRRESSSE